MNLKKILLPVIFSVMAFLPKDIFAKGHEYKVVVKDCTWNQAFQECINMGGRLATIDNSFEYEDIVKILEDNSAYSAVNFFIGGRRNRGSYDYCWVNTANQLSNNINTDSIDWYFDPWLDNQPSFSEEGIEETVLTFFKYKGNWGLNDETEDPVSTYPDFYPGKIGFICEFDNLTSTPNNPKGILGTWTNSDQTITFSDSQYHVTGYNAFGEQVNKTVDFWMEGNDNTFYVYTKWNHPFDFTIAEKTLYIREGENTQDPSWQFTGSNKPYHRVSYETTF